MTEEDEKVPTVMVSGGFDPVHAGHIRMIRHAAQYGDVIVIANSDDWLHRKKGNYLQTRTMSFFLIHNLPLN
mgnify:CR=1 FL=1